MGTDARCEAPRSLTPREEAFLVAMIRQGRHEDADGVSISAADRDRWLAQVPGVRAGIRCGCGSCPSIELTDETGGSPEIQDDRVVLEASVTGALILLFIDDDRLSYLELAPLSDKTSFRHFPDPRGLDART